MQFISFTVIHISSLPSLSLQLLLLCELWWDIHQFFHIAIKCTKTVFALCIICRVFSKIPAFDSVCLRWMDGWIKVKPFPPPQSKYLRYKYNNPPQSSSFMIYVRTAMTIAIPGLNSNHFTKKESTPKMAICFLDGVRYEPIMWNSGSTIEY